MAIKHFVIDSNVLVSAFVFNSKKPNEVLRHCLFVGKVALSAEVFEECKTTLLDEKFKLLTPLTKRESSLSLFSRVCEMVVPTEKITSCRDADDNKFLELAVAANATCIITGDKDLLSLHPFRDISILTPADFLNSY